MTVVIVQDEESIMQVRKKNHFGYCLRIFIYFFLIFLQRRQHQEWCLSGCDVPSNNEEKQCYDTLKCHFMLNDGRNCELCYIKHCEIPMNCINKTCHEIKLHEWTFWNLSIPCNAPNSEKCFD